MKNIFLFAFILIALLIGPRLSFGADNYDSEIAPSFTCIGDADVFPEFVSAQTQRNNLILTWKNQTSISSVAQVFQEQGNKVWKTKSAELAISLKPSDYYGDYSGTLSLEGAISPSRRHEDMALWCKRN